MRWREQENSEILKLNVFTLIDNSVNHYSELISYKLISSNTNENSNNQLVINSIQLIILLKLFKPINNII